MRISLLLIPVILLATGCPQPPKKSPAFQQPAPVRQPEPEFKTEFERLVWLLGSPSFAKRRTAHDKLFAMGRDIIPELEKAAGSAANEDHSHQIHLLITDLSSRETQEEEKDILVSLSIEGKSFEFKKPVVVSLEIKNTGNVPLEMTVPLLRMRSINFRLDWRADMSFVSDGKRQPFFANGTERDSWLKDKSWNPGTVTVKPGDSIKESFDVTDLCTRQASYTATATYRWDKTGEFISNAVSFEIQKPPAEKEQQEK